MLGTVTDITDLKNAEEELKQLSACLVNIQDQERRRIARELHDGTAQNLFAVGCLRNPRRFLPIVKVCVKQP
jgi:signal transduction histidine kinase